MIRIKSFDQVNVYDYVFNDCVFNEMINTYLIL
jgi:hypothetical protein